MCRPLLNCSTDDNDACPEGNRARDAFGMYFNTTPLGKSNVATTKIFHGEKIFPLNNSWSAVRCSNGRRINNGERTRESTTKTQMEVFCCRRYSNEIFCHLYFFRFSSSLVVCHVLRNILRIIRLLPRLTSMITVPFVF